MSDRHQGFTARIVRTFVNSRLSLLMLIGALIAGAVGLTFTAREEEPQIVVPLVDVLISYPGADPEEVERHAVTELESIVRGVTGVEHVYSEAREGAALVSIRFEVGHDREKALVDTFTRINANVDRAPSGLAGWIVRPVDIDDVPMLTLSLSCEGLDGFELRRLGEELADRLRRVDDVGQCTVIGGEPRVVEVELSEDALAARRMTILSVAKVLAAANSRATAGPLRAGDVAVTIGAGALLKSAAEVEEVVVGIHGGRPVLVRDVAQVREGPLEPATYTRIALGPAAEEAGLVEPGALFGERPAVALALSKRKASNAVTVAEEVLAEVEAARRDLLPADCAALVTRNGGHTANEKVNELIGHILVAVITVVLVLMVGLGWREALIVAIAVPVTFSVALFMDLIVGYTINRVTLFALVLSLGLLVDDPIVDVENIHRHLKLGTRSFRESIIYAVNEVRPPLILATLTVVVSFLPMFFITGMMGPYMGPMPFNIGVVMLTSLVVALTITPWAARLFLKEEGHHADPGDDPDRPDLLHRLYSTLMRPLLERRLLGLGFLAFLFLALIGSVSLAGFGIVPLKMLPFANKDRLQVTVEMPEGVSLETTDAAVRGIAGALLESPEVTFVESFSGTASPHDFQGLVRHEFLRAGDHVGDLRFGLLPKSKRGASSHEIALRIRPRLEEEARRHGARIQICEVPPGPPVLQTVVAEVTGPPGGSWEDQVAAARDVRERMEGVAGIVDADWTVPETPARDELVLDRTLAALHGVSAAEVSETLRLAVDRRETTALHVLGERNPLPLVVRLPREARSSAEDLGGLPLRYDENGGALTLSQVTRRVSAPLPRSITRKDLERVVFVTADTAGISPPEAVLALQASLDEDPLPPGYEARFSGEGEWKITLDVFRDLGIAFLAALIGIYVILVGQTSSLALPLVMMVAIPITAIGIFPGFWLINFLTAEDIGPFANPTYFTATAMIGMIALAGIVVRNSVILIDFIEVQRSEGKELARAVVEAGGVRLRPILLTASTSLLGVWVMTLDPVFSGLAWSFIFGILASTGFTLLAVPLVYYLLNRGKAGLQVQQGQ